MNIEKVIGLIKNNREDFLFSFSKRHGTSYSNKTLHKAAINFIEDGEWSSLSELLSYESYEVAFKCVVACLPYSCEDKEECYKEVCQ